MTLAGSVLAADFARPADAMHPTAVAAMVEPAEAYLASVCTEKYVF
jgi:hypothetical protein